MEAKAGKESFRPILIRLTGPHGTSRIKVENTGTVSDLFAAAEAALGSAPGSLALSSDLPGQNRLARDSRSLKQCGLAHGDQVFVQTGVSEYMSEPSAMQVDSPDDKPKPAAAKPASRTFRIDDIPDEVDEGKLVAKYTPTLEIVREAMLRHERGMNSQHAFADVGLEKFDYSAHQGFNSFRKASGHTRLHIRDAPKSVILTGQKHRHCDNVQMCDNGGLGNFTTAWQNGEMAEQCMAFMYGCYAPYDAFDHGVKAVVYALYEPPQQGQIEATRADKSDR